MSIESNVSMINILSGKMFLILLYIICGIVSTVSIAIMSIL